MMQVVILCGGKSKRFGGNTPKFLADIKGKTILQRVIESYVIYNNDCNFILVLGDNYDIVKSTYLGNYNITYIKTSSQCNTAGHLLEIESILDDVFLLTYADGFGDIDISKSIDTHMINNNSMTITSIPFTTNFGVVSINNGKVTSFNEKEIIYDKYVSIGYFICNKSIISYIKNIRCSLEYDVIPTLVKNGSVGYYIHTGEWKCVDTQQDYIEVCRNYSK